MKKTIGLVTSGLSFNGNTINEKALGGSESAMIYIARELAALRNEVTVYCPCDIPGIYDNVEYRSLDMYLIDEKSQFDVLVVSRFTDFLAVPLDTKMNILWCHDIDSTNFRDAIGVADRVFCLSDYHRQLFVDNYSIEPINYIWKTSNGFDETIETPFVPFEQKKNNYIYASRPERGLKLLLEKIWPEIVEKNPDAVLNICGYDHDIGIPEDVKKIYDEIDELLDYSTNVKTVKHLPKSEYYQLLSNCAYMVYPTDFPEISCINAIEAQRNGCLIISSDKFALSETVKTDTLVKEEYGSKEYIAKFLNLLDEYTEDKYEQEVAKGKELINRYSWKTVAKSWDSEINSMFKKRAEKYKDKIVKNLVYNSDIFAAWKLTGEHQYRDMLDKAQEDNLTISYFYNGTIDEDRFLNPRGLQLIDVVEKKIAADPSKKLKILDLGSNDGILSLPLLKRFSNNIESLHMVDSSSDCLSHMESQFKHKYPQLQFVVDNVTSIEKYNFLADVVIVGELLEHIENTQEFLNILMTVATSNTTFYFTTPRGPWENIITNNKEIHHIHHFELNDIKQIFNQVDLSISSANMNVKGKRGERCDNWLFWFDVSAGDDIKFGEIDYEDKLLKSRPYKSISACMIVRNEEDNIARCLKSLNGFVDEIIVVDTGSTDDTKRIVEKYTDKIYDLEWLEEDGLGNFSRARNYSIDQASGDYIFWIDADEQVESWQNLFKYITSDYYDGMLLKQKQCMSLDSHKMGINVDVMHDRLFKRGKIRFTGVVLEYPSKDGEHFLGKMFWQDYAWILHYGLANHELLKRKSIGRNSDLIYKNVRTYPDRVFAKHYILVDYWSKFITDHPKPDFTWLERGMEMWHKELKNCGDDWTIRLSLGVVQHFYSYCAINNIAYKGKLPEKLAFQNVNGEVIDFYVLDEETERDFFFKYLSTYKR
jgi:glycosyltransferase involved in cell wall biosynthesis/2-polyprenyl-3-methyl-5-hydroxy-6-metoxy-1,4-benzoquinol methylase